MNFDVWLPLGVACFGRAPAEFLDLWLGSGGTQHVPKTTPNLKGRDVYRRTIRATIRHREVDRLRPTHPEHGCK